ncbi:MAG: M48 family metallopeptidase [Bacteroidota bacterium]|nr:M48 family metallopeptidase [Bacteroidota bacterium]
MIKTTIAISLMLLFQTSCVQSQKNGPLGKEDRLSQTVKKQKKTNHSTACLSDDIIFGSSEMISETEKIAITFSGVSISAQEENKFGDDTFKELKSKNDYTFITSGNQYQALQHMLNDLLLTRNKKSGLTYTIHLIKDETVNAFTAGGHIYITTGIIEYADSESAVAAIVGHEIGHNEKGHLNMLLKKMKLANGILPGSGQIGVGMQQFISPFFNQVNEIEADFYGIDMCIAAGYDAREGLGLWKRMAEKESKKNPVESFLRSHPYSNDRHNCIKSYLKKSYSI